MPQSCSTRIAVPADGADARAASFHLVMGRAIDLAESDVTARRDAGPRHVMGQIAKELGAAIHAPTPAPPVWRDRLRAWLSSRPEHWALARRLAVETPGESAAVLFCTGEDVGIPVAALCGGRKHGPKVAVFIHNLDRPRGRLAARWHRAARRVDLFITNASHQANFLHEALRVPAEKIWLRPDQTDTRFFSPGESTLPKTRPIVASVGLEKRDYRTLAAATHDLPIDVRISGFSRDAATLAKAFPQVLPENMTRQYYDWRELRELYRAADLLVVPLFENNYSAGVNALLEGLACRRPVIVSGTRGLRDNYLPEGVAAVVPPGDAAALRGAIEHWLAHPQEAAATAERGHAWVVAQHNSEDYCAAFAARLRRLAGRQS